MKKKAIKNELNSALKKTVSAYKHYFRNVPQKSVNKFIAENLKYCDRLVFNARLSKGLINTDQKVFFDYCEGRTRKEISSKYQISLYEVNHVIHKTRSEMVKQINKEINSGKLGPIFNAGNTPYERILKDAKENKTRQILLKYGFRA